MIGKRGNPHTGFRLYPFRGDNRGFSLLELVVAVSIFVILTAIIIYNWSSFVQYQEMRKDAFNLHKELIALKATALKENCNYQIIPDMTNHSYVIRKVISAGNTQDIRTVQFRNNVVFKDSLGTGNPPEACCLGDGWGGADGIVIEPSNTDAFDPGRIYIGSTKLNKGFCIQRGNNVINPQIFYWDGSSWELM